MTSLIRTSQASGLLALSLSATLLISGCGLAHLLPADAARQSTGQGGTAFDGTDEMSASASSVAAGPGIPMWLSDSSTGAALADALPPGLLEGAHATVPGAPTPPEFRTRLLDLDPGLTDTTYAPEAYDAVILIALAAIAAQSDVGTDIARLLPELTHGRERCDSYSACRDVQRRSGVPDYVGLSGPIALTRRGDPTVATIGDYLFGADTQVLPEGEFDLVARPEPMGDDLPVGPAQSGADDGRLTIGALLPTTGQLAFAGSAALAGVRLAVQDVQAFGELPGIGQVRLVVEDSGDGTPAMEQAATARLLAADVDAVVGPAASSTTLSVMGPITASGVVLISPISADTTLSSGTRSGLFFRTAPTDALQGRFLGLAAASSGHSRIAVIAVDDTYGRGLADAVIEVLDEAGAVSLRLDVPRSQSPPSTDTGSSADTSGASAMTAQADALAMKVAAFHPSATILVAYDEIAPIVLALDRAGVGPRPGRVFVSSPSATEHSQADPT